MSDTGVAAVKLGWWRKEVAESFAGRPTHPVMKALMPHVSTYGILASHLAAVIDGCQVDLEQTRFLDFAALARYCHLVAGVVGEVAANIFGRSSDATVEYAHRVVWLLLAVKQFRPPSPVRPSLPCLAEGPAMRHLLLPLAVAAALVAGCAKTEPAPEPIRAVRIVTVAADAAGGVQEYAAEVRARTESRLGFRVGGKLVRRLVDAGSVVKAGQVLAQLDPQDLRLGQDAARAALVAAQANHDQTLADFKRYKDLRDQGFISSAELERRDTALKAAQAQLDQAKAQASVQGNQAAYATLVADASGVITGVDAEPGMVVASGAPVVRLAHDGPRDVVFSVPEDKVSLLKALAGQPGRFKVRLWGAGGEPLPAAIREIAAAADPVTRTFVVKADLAGAASSQVRLGQTATLLVEMPKTVGVSKLPLSALKEEQGRTVVWIVDKGSMTVKPQPVQLAGADGNDAVITAGLIPGQMVVTAGVHVLTPGQKVKLYVDPGVAAGATAAAMAATALTIK